MNELKIGNSIFTIKTIYDEQIKAGSLTLAQTMIGDELSADEMEFTVISGEEDALFDSDLEKLKDSNNQFLLAAGSFGIELDLTDTPYGTKISFLRKEMDYSLPIPAEVEVYIATMYITEVKQISKGMWNIKAQSAMGMLINQQHNGGIYIGETVKSVIDDIMSGVSGISYLIANSVKNEPVTGWLPVASCRDNLQQLCFSLGISIIKTGSGGLTFKYNEPNTPSRSILNDEIYLGATRNSPSPVSSVTVYEHSYYPITTAVRKTVFDNVGGVAAVDQKVIFENPIIVSTLLPAVGDTSGSLVVTEAGANYAIVSGTGTLTGVEYSHSYKVLTEVINDSSNVQGKEIVYKDATLVNPLNSTNCLKRIAAYYSLAGENQVDFVASAFPHVDRPGDLVAYPDPYTSDMVSGLIKTMNVTISGIMKSQSTITSGWLPRYLGNNFSRYFIVDTSNPTFSLSTMPDYDGGDIRIVLIGGGQGGQGGQGGRSGQAGQATSQEPYCGVGGAGGIAGVGGTAGKVFITDISSPSATYAITIGTGGTGGTGGASDADGADGALGGDTTFGTYSSSSGTSPDYGYANPLDPNTLYSQNGDNGLYKGGSGADGSIGSDGEDVATYKGGLSGNGWIIGNPYSIAGFGGGGGAAYGNNGNPGTDGTAPGHGSSDLYAGNGGNGADAISATQNILTYGSGGRGGCGGGGGGGGGNSYSTYYVQHPGSAGTGGKGGNGSDGNQGCVIVFY